MTENQKEMTKEEFRELFDRCHADLVRVGIPVAPLETMRLEFG